MAQLFPSHLWIDDNIKQGYQSFCVHHQAENNATVQCCLCGKENWAQSYDNRWLGSLFQEEFVRLGFSRHSLEELAVTSEGHVVENQGSENLFIAIHRPYSHFLLEMCSCHEMWEPP